MRILPIAAALFALPLLAQEPIPDQPFAESIDVNVANVEVYVTGRDGRPAQGLAKEDFDLLVDGGKVEIVNFSEVAEGSPAPPTWPMPSKAAAAAPSGLDKPAAPEAAPPPDPLSLVVFVDNANLRPFGRNRVLRQVRDFLDSTVGPRDRVLLVTHDQGLTVRRPLSAGKESLAADLAKLEKLAARGTMMDHSARTVMETIRSLGCDRADEAMQLARGHAQSVRDDALATLRGLASLVESLSGIEGRKMVLYVSDGIPMHPGEDVFQFLYHLCGGEQPGMSTEELSSRFRRVTQLANAEGVTFYTLESSGPSVYASASAEDNPTAGMVGSTVMQFEKTADSQQILFNLASETGGRAVLNGNDIRTDLSRIREDFRSYYSLGYAPERSGDGRSHSIQVKLRREGLRIRNRTTYTDLPRDERIAARVQTALLHGLVDNPLQAGLDLTRDQPGQRGQREVTLRVRLPLKQIVLVSQGGSWTGQVTLWIGVRDGEGRMAPVQKVRVPVRIPSTVAQEQLASRVFAYDIRMKMAERGEQTVAVGVQDDLGHVLSFITGAFKVDRKGVTAMASGRPGR
jgi:VWFA-related protein